MKFRKLLPLVAYILFGCGSEEPQSQNTKVPTYRNENVVAQKVEDTVYIHVDDIPQESLDTICWLGIEDVERSIVERRIGNYTSDIVIVDKPEEAGTEEIKVLLKYADGRILFDFRRSAAVRSGKLESTYKRREDEALKLVGEEILRRINVDNFNQEDDFLFEEFSITNLRKLESVPTYESGGVKMQKNGEFVFVMVEDERPNGNPAYTDEIGIYTQNGDHIGNSDIGQLGDRVTLNGLLTEFTGEPSTLNRVQLKINEKLEEKRIEVERALGRQRLKEAQENSIPETENRELEEAFRLLEARYLQTRQPEQLATESEDAEEQSQNRIPLTKGEIKTYRSGNIVIQVDGDTTYILSRNHTSPVLEGGIDVALVDIGSDGSFESGIVHSNGTQKSHGPIMAELLGKEAVRVIGIDSLSNFGLGRTQTIGHEDKLEEHFRPMKESKTE